MTRPRIERFPNGSSRDRNPLVPLLPRGALLALALPGLTYGCSSLLSSSSTSATPAPTAIVIEPSAFVGSLSCDESPGDLKRYVATLVDVTSTDAGRLAAIPSSPPSPCYEPVIFQQTQVNGVPTLSDGREYVAKIDGYDSVDLRPQSPGSPVMVNSAGAVVQPKWNAKCGEPQPIAGFAVDGGDGGDAAAKALLDASVGTYGNCRARLLPDAQATGDLSGPVCVYGGLTVVMRHCTFLRPR